MVAAGAPGGMSAPCAYRLLAVKPHNTSANRTLAWPEVKPWILVITQPMPCTGYAPYTKRRLSPLGEDFDSRDLIAALRAHPIIVAPNKLGVVNHVRLTLEALPKKQRSKAIVVLMSPAKPL